MVHIAPPPPVGVHPRIFFNPEDVPNIRSRLTSTTTEGPVLWATIQAFARNNLTNIGGQWNAAYSDLSNGVTDSFAARGDGNNMAQCMSYEAFRCLIANDTVNAQKLCAALTTLANYEYSQMAANPSGDWRNSFSFRLCFEGLGYAYDFAYNFMTPAQQQAVRRALILGTTNQWSIGMDVPPGFNCNNSNWILNNSLYLIMDALAVEGEEGSDPNVIPRSIATFERFYSTGVLPDGALYEGMGKGALYEESLLAIAKRGVLLHSAKSTLNYYRQFAIGCLETTGYGFTWDELLGGNFGVLKYADSPVMKWFFPNDPVIDFLHRNELGANYLSSPNLTGVNSAFLYDEMIQLIRAITVQDFNTSLTWDQAVQQQVVPNVPLTQLLNYRGLVITRSDWSSNGMRLMFQPRSVWGGHSIPDRNNFNLSALGASGCLRREEQLPPPPSPESTIMARRRSLAAWWTISTAQTFPMPPGTRGGPTTVQHFRDSRMTTCSTSPRLSHGRRDCKTLSGQIGTAGWGRPRRWRRLPGESRKLFALQLSYVEARGAKIM